MENLDQIASMLALTMGAAWASGINLYAAILVLGWMGAGGYIDLPPELTILENPLVMFAAGAMYIIEFFADKVPGVDSGWDIIHTFIRIPAGAMMAAGAVGPVDPAIAVAAGILGGGISAATHATKAGGRAIINTSPEPFSNWLVSIGEDLTVIAGLWTALHHPWLFLLLFILFMLFLSWLLPKLWRGFKLLMTRLKGLFVRTTEQDQAAGKVTSEQTDDRRVS
ncbi:MAG: DUF4126 domain-containing protein [Zetaproteobacteria bacterium]|nr:MAG: DUF4126 domain-containing protein [Zetaproteobacteria bacterium]